jgi:diguanylate cyclase (GGDEF)-like protein
LPVSISALVKILGGLYVLSLLLGGRSFYYLFSSLKTLSGQYHPGALASVRMHAELDLYSFCALAGIFSVLLFIFYRTLASLKNLHRMIDYQVGERFFDGSGNPYVYNEIKEFERDLNVVARKLREYGQRCLDASPLTRLPGNIAIERVLIEKMRYGEKFALCYADLDNFKFFNDRYGFTVGSEVLKMTGEIVRVAKMARGNRNDFVGHIGGDDFVIITSPDKAASICERIIQDFDKSIINYYRPEDLTSGVMIGKDRYGVERSFPIMSISISVVSDAFRDLKSPTEIARIAAEIKEYVKQKPGSNYLIDRRRRPYAD